MTTMNEEEMAEKVKLHPWELSEEDFIKKYKPIMNEDEVGQNFFAREDDGSTSERYGWFETYGEERQKVLDVWEENPKKIWTCIQEDGESGLLAGFHFVNRIYYVITEVPWEDEDTWVRLWWECNDENGCVCEECDEIWSDEAGDWIERPDGYVNPFLAFLEKEGERD